MKKVELLAPAGNFECLKAAIKAGCDAVYLSGKLYGARSFAGNFTNEEIKEAVKYAHLYGVKVYVTINTIIYDREIDGLLDFVRFIHKNNVDAVLVQDYGVFDLLRKKFPNLEIHASTQMHIHNYDSALVAKKLGFKRIVISRETSIDEIKKIKENIPLEVETFIHGALCLGYSGQCLMSTLIGNRSGNRGTCAQICRKKYNLYDDKNNKLNCNSYLLSTKELCTLNYIDKLIDIGVDSLKIEGRMKKKEYVYMVVKTYRKVVDNYYKYGTLKIDKEDIYNLKLLFNREFTKGFMFKEDNNNFTYDYRGNHIGVKLGEVVKKVNDNLSIKLSHELNLNDGIRVLDEKEDKGIIVTSMFINNKRVSSAKKGDVVTIKFSKYAKKGSQVLLTSSKKQLDSINYELKSVKRKVPININCTITDKSILLCAYDGINSVQKEAFIVKKAINRPLDKEEVKKQLIKTGDTVYEVNNINISISDNLFINIKDLNELRRDVLNLLDEKRMYDIPFVEKEYKVCLKDYKKEMLYENKNSIPRISRASNNYPKLDEKVLITELGALNHYKNYDIDYTFNVVNKYALAFFNELGADNITLSCELTLKQIKDLIDDYHETFKKHPNTSVIINSYIEAMISKYSLNTKYNKDELYLEDEYKNRYKIKSNKDYMTIYHYDKINNYSKDEIYNLGVNKVRENI